MNWTKVKEATGDNVTITLNPVQRAMLISAMANLQYAGEHAPQVMNISEDETDNFDAQLSDVMSKLAAS
jgi:hypothetical protein